MNVLGLDLETSGVDVDNDLIIEIGAAVWDTDRRKPMTMMSDMIKIELELPEIVTKVTGITDKDLAKFGKPVKEVMAKLFDMAKTCNYIVAHNGNGFDKPIIERYFKKFPEYKIDLPWIDTILDVPYPAEIVTRKLPFLAAEHDFLNPFTHRALFDSLTMLKILARYKFNDILTLQESANVRVVAMVSYEKRHLARDLGFRWDPDSRQWYKVVKEAMLKDTHYPFKTERINMDH